LAARAGVDCGMMNLTGFAGRGAARQRMPSRWTLPAV